MPAKPSIEERGGAVVVHLRVQPRASRNAIQVEHDGRIRVALRAPPLEGKANRALCELMAKTVGVSKRAVRLAGGEKSRDKTVIIQGLSLLLVRERLAREGPSSTEEG